MDPITVAIAVALAQGLVQVGGKLLEKGVVEPALEPATEGLKRLVQRGYQDAEEDKALLSAVQTAFREIGAPKEEDDVRRYLLNLGFDRLQAEGDAPLRQELARSVLLMTAPASDLIPDTLLRRLRWPSSRRQILADFLTALRRPSLRSKTSGALLSHTPTGRPSASICAPWESIWPAPPTLPSAVPSTCVPCWTAED
jgi:hypothetical protein